MICRFDIFAAILNFREREREEQIQFVSKKILSSTNESFHQGFRKTPTVCSAAYQCQVSPVLSGGLGMGTEVRP